MATRVGQHRPGTGRQLILPGLQEQGSTLTLVVTAQLLGQYCSEDNHEGELLAALEWPVVRTGSMTATSRCLQYHRDPLMGFRNAFILVYWLQLERHMILILARSLPFEREVYKSIN